MMIAKPDLAKQKIKMLKRNTRKRNKPPPLDIKSIMALLNIDAQKMNGRRF
jgi:hypothetical protein